ncbi:hypothetical protein BDR26DRAFT_862633 [Obelidium mucronatum]|nr:hypothetical protein BDR26DRAFT_862633 [Obelidium mucronatum]
MSILKSKASGEGIDTALDAIGSGFDTVPTSVEFPIRLETKYSDAVGQVSAIFYKWKGTPIFAYNIDFYGFWDDQKGHLDVGFTRERFDTRLYPEFREFPKSLASFLPPKKDIQMINCLSRCDYDGLPEELLENVDAFSFLKVIRYVNEIEELSGSLEFSEQIFGCSTDILPDFDVVVSADEGGDE